jgi:peroxiredoxin Q/BCP
MQAPDFALPNVAAGPDPYRLSERAGAVSAVVLLLQRDHYCTNCRRQVREVKARVAAFRERDAEPVSVLPEPVERAREWQASYDLPYPLLADAAADVGEAYDQPVRFGALGSLSDFFGRMPEAVVVDLRPGREREVAYAHRGRSTFDRPSVDDLLAVLDDLPPVDGAGVGADGATDE